MSFYFQTAFMMKKWIAAIVGLFIVLTGVVYAGQKSSADKKSPVGVWKTIDDSSGEAKSHVQIWREPNGTLSGKLIKFLQPAEADNPERLCKKCSGSRKNKPVLNMTILWNMKAKRKNKSDRWVGGKILDPDNGETYGCNLTVRKNGAELEVRGYMGISLLGRTQTWHRVK